MIVSDEFTRPIKLSHDAEESMNDEKKGFIKTITLENVCSVRA